MTITDSMKSVDPHAVSLILEEQHCGVARTSCLIQISQQRFGLAPSTYPAYLLPIDACPQSSRYVCPTVSSGMSGFTSLLLSVHYCI